MQIRNARTSWPFSSLSKNRIYLILGGVSLGLLLYILGNSDLSRLNIQSTSVTFSGENLLSVSNCDSIDSEAPIVICPGLQTLVLDGNCEAGMPDYSNLVTSSDNCGSVTTTQDPISGTMYGSTDLDSTIVVTITAEDDSMNVSSCSFSVVIRDRTTPTVTCPGDQILELDQNCVAILPDYSILAAASDNCDPVSYTQLPAPGTVYDSTAIDSNLMITIMAVDSSGNSAGCILFATIVDVLPPQFTCLGDQVIQVDENCEAEIPDYSALVTANENCGSISWTQVPAAGTILGSTDVSTSLAITLSADDGNGNISDCHFMLTISDTIGPTFNCLADHFISLDTSCEALLPDYELMLAADDNCGDVIITQTPPSGTLYTSSDLGMVVAVTLSLDDGHGNSSDCIFLITIVDTISPSLMCPADQIVPLEQFCQAFLPDYTSLVTASDNCSSTTITQSPSAGTFLPPGSMSVSMLAVDESGNESSCTFMVSVMDTTAPIIDCPGDITVVNDPFACGAVLEWSAMATDDCLPDFEATRTDSTGFNSGDLIPVGTHIISYVASDSSGNITICEFVITVEDMEQPILSCENITVEADMDVCTASEVSLPMPEATDNCEVDTITHIAPLLYEAGSNVVVWTAIDIYGNIDTCHQIVTVVETQLPEAICKSDTLLQLGMDQTVSITAEQIDSGSTDNCGIATFSINQTSFGCYDLGTFPITLTVTDLAGNMATCETDVTITSSAANGVYVDSSNTSGIFDGLTWATAYPSLQGVLFNDCLSDVDTIFMAEGTYYPSQFSRSASFFLLGDVVIVGGFSSGGGVHDPDLHETKLSGEIGGGSASDNSYHVLTIHPAANNVKLFDLTIEGGNASGPNTLDKLGGGVLAFGTATFGNVVFRANQSGSGGAALYVTADGDVELRDVLATGNSSADGPLETELGGQLSIDPETIIE